MELAERNYELVGELGLGDKATGTALWLVGALQMAAGRSSTATAQFLRAEEAFQAAQLPVPAAMARGYVALAEKALPGLHPPTGSFRDDGFRLFLVPLRTSGVIRPEHPIAYDSPRSSREMR